MSAAAGRELRRRWLRASHVRCGGAGTRLVRAYGREMESPARPVPRVFLLSPARSDGPRADVLVHSPGALGEGLRSERGAALGHVYAWLSSLYFRGKLTYATHFGVSTLAAPSVLVITPGHGLCRPSTPVRASDLAAIAAIDVAADNPHFVEPLLRDARLLRDAVADETEIVLLGSVATPKYVDPLLAVFGGRLLFPREFVGRGDMSRGGLLLRAVRAGIELDYVPVQTSVRSGPRARRIAELGSGER